MIYGYARVSTKGQDKYGNGLEVQEKQLRENGAEIIYYESFTGMKKSRPELDKLMGVLKEGDTLVVTKLDRVARSTRDGLDIIDALLNKGVYINILNMGKFDHTPTGKLMRTVFFAFAEFERDMIVMRTGEGKAMCRENDPNWREGRKALEVPDFNHYYELVQKVEITVVEACKLLGISRSKWYSLCKTV